MTNAQSLPEAIDDPGLQTGGTQAPRPGKPAFLVLALGSIGVVYGDIGTSPLYALREAVKAALPSDGAISEPLVLGVLSLIIWALILVVTVKYVLVLINADNNGEGGTLSLMALAQRGRGKFWASIPLLGMLGAALYLWRCHDHACHFRTLSRGRPEPRHSGLRALCAVDHAGHHCRPVCRAVLWHGASGEPLWPNHPHLVCRHRSHGCIAYCDLSRRALVVQSAAIWHCAPELR